MFSLDWVSIKAQIMGPAHLINDYVEYGPILDKEVSKRNLTMCETKKAWILSVSVADFLLSQKIFKLLQVRVSPILL